MGFLLTLPFKLFGLTIAFLFAILQVVSTLAGILLNPYILIFVLGLVALGYFG